MKWGHQWGRDAGNGNETHSNSMLNVKPHSNHSRAHPDSLTTEESVELLSQSAGDMSKDDLQLHAEGESEDVAACYP